MLIFAGLLIELRADLKIFCVSENALYMKVIHGRKTKKDPVPRRKRQDIGPDASR